MKKKVDRNRSVIANNNQSDKLKSEETALRCEIESESKEIIDELYSEHTKATKRQLLPLDRSTSPEITKAIEDVEQKSAELVKASKALFTMIEIEVALLPNQLVIDGDNNNEYIMNACKTMIKFVDELYTITKPTDYKLVGYIFDYFGVIYKLRIIADYYDVQTVQIPLSSMIIEMAQTFINFASSTFDLLMHAILEDKEGKELFYGNFCNSIKNMREVPFIKQHAYKWNENGIFLKNFISGVPPLAAYMAYDLNLDYEAHKKETISKINQYAENDLRNLGETGYKNVEDTMIEALNRCAKDRIVELQKIVDKDNRTKLKEICLDAKNLKNIFDGLVGTTGKIAQLNQKVEQLEHHKLSKDIQEKQKEMTTNLSSEIDEDLNQIYNILYRIGAYYEIIAQHELNFVDIRSEIGKLFILDSKQSKLFFVTPQQSIPNLQIIKLTVILKTYYAKSLIATNECTNACILDSLLIANKINFKDLYWIRDRFTNIRRKLERVLNRLKP